MVLIALVVSLTVGTGARVEAQADLIGPIYAEGVRHYNAQNFVAAVDYFGQVCDMLPDHQQARFYLTSALIEAGAYDKALPQAQYLNLRWPGVPQYQALLQVIQSAAPTGQGLYSLPATPPTPSPLFGTRRLRYAPPQETWIGEHQAIRGTGEIPLSPPREGKPRIKERTPLDDALEALDSQQYASAIDQFDRLIAKNPKDAAPRHYRGVIEYQQQHFDEALKHFGEVLKLDPKHFDTLHLQGEIYLRRGDLDAAEKSFEQALAVREDAFTMVALAQVKRQKGAHAKALEMFEKVLKVEPANAEARVALADTRIDQGKLDLAAKLVNEVLQENPDSAGAHYVKGKLLLAGGLPEDAVQELQRAIAIDPREKTYKIVLARAWLAMGRPDGALSQTVELLQQDENDWDAQVITAEALISTGALADAEDHLAKARAVRAGGRLVLLEARMAAQQGDRERAIGIYEKHLEADKNDLESRLEYAGVLEAAGKIEEAKRALRDIVDNFAGTAWADRAEGRLEVLRGGSGIPTASTGGSSAPATPAAPPKPPKVDPTAITEPEGPPPENPY